MAQHHPYEYDQEEEEHYEGEYPHHGHEYPDEQYGEEEEGYPPEPYEPEEGEYQEGPYGNEEEGPAHGSHVPQEQGDDFEEQLAKALEASKADAPKDNFDDELARALEASMAENNPKDKFDDELAAALEASKAAMPSEEDEIARALAASKADDELEAALKMSMIEINDRPDEDAQLEQVLRLSMLESLGRSSTSGGEPSRFYSGSSQQPPALPTWQDDESVDLDPHGRGKGPRQPRPAFTLPPQPETPPATSRGLPPSYDESETHHAQRMQEAEWGFAGNLHEGQVRPLNPTQSAESRAIGEIRGEQDRAYMASLTADRAKMKKRIEEARKAAERAAEEAEAARRAEGSSGAGDDEEVELEDPEYIKAKRLERFSR